MNSAARSRGKWVQRMGRKSAQGLPPGIQLDQNGAYWASLEGDDAKLWRARYPGRSRPRKKAKTLDEAVILRNQLSLTVRTGRDLAVEKRETVDLMRSVVGEVIGELEGISVAPELRKTINQVIDKLNTLLW